MQNSSRSSAVQAKATGNAKVEDLDGMLQYIHSAELALDAGHVALLAWFKVYVLSGNFANRLSGCGPKAPEKDACALESLKTASA
jgi:hypothetical protein